MSRRLDEEDEGALNNPFFEPDADQRGGDDGDGDLFSFDIHRSLNSLRSEVSSRLPIDQFQFRDLPTVFGAGEPNPFNFPPAQIFMARVKNNSQYYALNYATLILLVAGASIITNPLAFLALVLLAVGWLFARSLMVKLQHPRHANIELPFIGRLNPRHVFYAMMLLSAVLVAAIMSSLFTWIFWVSLIFVAGHMITREHRNVRSRPEAPPVSPDLLETGMGSRSRKTVQ